MSGVIDDKGSKLAPASRDQQVSESHPRITPARKNCSLGILKPQKQVSGKGGALGKLAGQRIPRESGFGCGSLFLKSKDIAEAGAEVTDLCLVPGRKRRDK
jgi:hypothetical protein